LRPDYTVDEFDRYLQRELESSGRGLSAIIWKMFYQFFCAGFWPPLRRPPDQRCSMINRSERKQLPVCSWTFASGSADHGDRRGDDYPCGVALEEINPQTMESRLVKVYIFAAK